MARRSVSIVVLSVREAENQKMPICHDIKSGFLLRERLQTLYKANGAAALRHRACRRRFNRAPSDGLHQLALARVRKHYGDCGPTLAAGNKGDPIRALSERRQEFLPESPVYGVIQSE